MPGSDLRRRSRNGPIRSANCRALVGSRPDSIGAPHTRRNACRLPSSPGIAQSRIDQSSVRSFSTGVPVSATRARLGIGPQVAGRRRAGVLDVLRLVGDDQVPRHRGQGGVVAPHGAVRRQHEPAVAAASTELARPSPWKRRTGRPGANRADLGLPVAEQAGRADDERRPARAPCSSRWRWSAIRVIVLPRPMSSARQAPRPSAGEVGEPGQAVALVVAQLGPERRRRPAAARGSARRAAARGP